jgi:hypothetical protein
MIGASLVDVGLQVANRRPEREVRRPEAGIPHPALPSGHLIFLTSIL